MISNIWFVGSAVMLQSEWYTWLQVKYGFIIKKDRMQIPINVYFLKQRVLRASKRDLEQEISTTLDQDWIFFLQNFRSTKQANVE